MSKWLRTGVFTGALLCALVLTGVPAFAQGEDAGDAEVLQLSVPDSGDTSGATTWWSTNPCVPDRVAPEITLAGDNPEMLFNGENYVEAGFATVIDVCDGDMLGLPAMPEQVTIEFWFNAALVYTATVLYDDMVAEIEDIFNVLGDADRSADPIVPNPFNVIGGQHTIRYLVADAAGNVAQADRVVEVITEPVILLQGAADVTLECGTEFVDDGALAFEADGTPIAVTDDSDTVLVPNVTGVYVITYTAQPAEGAPLTVTRNVTVEDTQAPEIAVPGTEITLECGSGPFTSPAPLVAVDLCDGLIQASEVTIDPVEIVPSAAGTYAINYSVADAAGNVGTNSRTVIVQDTTPPTIDLVGNAALNLGCDDSYGEAGVENVADLCSGALSNVMVSMLLYGFEQASDIYIGDFEGWFNDNYVGNGGEYTFVYSVTDASDNVATVERDLTITCPKSLELRVAEDMRANFDADDTAKGNGILNADELNAVYERVLLLFPNLTRTRFDNMIIEIQNPPYGEGDVTLAAIEAYIGAITPTLHIELIGDNPLNLECADTFVDPGAAVFWGNVQVAIVNTADVVNTGATGDTTVTYAYTGFDQPEVTVTRTISVADTTGPVIGAVPATRNVECNTAYSNSVAVVIDACEGFLAGAAVISGDTVDTSVAGAVFQVIFDAQDSLGNPAEQIVQTVTIVDTQAPVVTIDGGDTLQGECGVELQLPTASAADSCDGALSASISNNGGLNALAPAVGVYSVVYSATDASENEGTATLTVTITDTVEPVITIAGGNTLQGECGVELTLPEATVADDCDSAATLEITGLGGLDTKDPIAGVYTVTYEAMDASSNVATAELTVTVEDTLAPVITIVGGNTLTAECGVLMETPAATAVDDCDGALDAGILDQGGLDVINPLIGEYQVTYAARDAAGNQGEAILTVTVEDTTAPVVTITGGDTMLAECATPIVLPDATADDACEGVLAAEVFSQGELDIANPVVGVYEVVYQATDGQGNVGSATLTVTVEDNAGPAVTIDGGNTLQVECKAAVTLPGATALDACEGVAYTAAMTDLDGLDVDSALPGTYNVVYESEADGQGNVGTATLVVTVADTVAPVVTIEGPEAITVECNVAVTLPNAAADDDCDGVLVATATDLGGLNLANPVLGEFVVTYTAVDAANNTGSDTLTVTVGDTTKPVITLLGDNPAIVECGSTYNFPGYSAADTCDGNLTASVLRVGTVDTNVTGVYNITYNVVDSSGNAADEEVHVVNVVDTTNPLLAISPSLGLTIVNVNGFDVHQVPCNTDWDALEGPLTQVEDSCANLGWLDVVVTAWPLNPADFSVNGAPILDKSFVAVPGYYQLDYAVSDGTNMVDIVPGRYIQVDTQCTAVPNVFNQTEAAAVTAIEDAGLVANVQVAYSDLVPIGNVFEQNPAAGTLVAPGATVNITVARNVVPDLTGLTEAGAAAALTAVGLQLNIAGTTRTLDAALTGVYDQDVAAGTILNALDAVAVSVYVPLVTGLTETAAVAAIEGADYTADITYQWSDTIAADIVIEQPNAGNGTTVPIVVSLGKQPSAVFLKPPTPMTVQCAAGQVWVDVDPLAEVQAGDGTVLVDNLATDTLELSDGMGGWVAVDPANDVLLAGEQYRAIYKYTFDDPGVGPVTLTSEPRIIGIVDTTSPSEVTVLGDDPANMEPLPAPYGNGYVYHMPQGTYSSWQALAAAEGTVPPAGILGIATDACEGQFDSASNPEKFEIDVQYYDGMGLTPVGTFALDNTWLGTAGVGYYVVTYVASDGAGNQTYESAFRVISVE